MGRLTAIICTGVLLTASACSSPTDTATQSSSGAPESHEASTSTGNRTSETPWWIAATVEPEPIDEAEPPDLQLFEISGDVLFAVGSAELNPASGSQMVHILRLLTHHPETAVLIVGYTDNTPRPTPEHNQQLSEARAEAVADWLTERGVDRERIATKGRADREPVATNDTDAGRAANRRVAITVSSGEEAG